MTEIVWSSAMTPPSASSTRPVGYRPPRVRATSCVLSPSSARNTTTKAVSDVSHRYSRPLGNRPVPVRPPSMRRLAASPRPRGAGRVRGLRRPGRRPRSGAARTPTGGRVTLVADDLRWDTDCLRAAPGPLTIEVDNRDDGQNHNVHLPDAPGSPATDLEQGPSRQELEVDLARRRLRVRLRHPPEHGGHAHGGLSEPARSLTGPVRGRR